MAVRIKLTDGTEVLVRASVDELGKALRSAGLLEIEQPDGRKIAITPQAIEWMEEEPDAEAGLAERFAQPAVAH